MTQGIVDTQVAIFYERPTCASSPAALSQARGRRLRQWATDWNRRVFGPFEAYSRMTHTTTKKMWVMTRAQAHGYHHRLAPRGAAFAQLLVVVIPRNSIMCQKEIRGIRAIRGQKSARTLVCGTALHLHSWFKPNPADPAQPFTICARGIRP